MATRLNIANTAEHRALSDARLVKDVFLVMLKGMPTVKTTAELMRVSQLLRFTDAPVFTSEPPSGFEVLTTAISDQYAITIIYESGWPRPTPRMITPRLVLDVHGVAYVIAYCHLCHAERTFQLDRIRECWLA